jgi:hypothetical protein
MRTFLTTEDTEDAEEKSCLPSPVEGEGQD